MKRRAVLSGFEKIKIRNPGAEPDWRWCRLHGFEIEERLWQLDTGGAVYYSVQQLFRDATILCLEEVMKPAPVFYRTMAVPFPRWKKGGVSSSSAWGDTRDALRGRVKDVEKIVNSYYADVSVLDDPGERRALFDRTLLGLWREKGTAAFSCTRILQKYFVAKMLLATVACKEERNLEKPDGFSPLPEGMCSELTHGINVQDGICDLPGWCRIEIANWGRHWAVGICGYKGGLNIEKLFSKRSTAEGSRDDPEYVPSDAPATPPPPPPPPPAAGSGGARTRPRRSTRFRKRRGGRSDDAAGSHAAPPPPPPAAGSGRTFTRPRRLVRRRQEHDAAAYVPPPALVGTKRERSDLYSPGLFSPPRKRARVAPVTDVSKFAMQFRAGLEILGSINANDISGLRILLGRVVDKQSVLVIAIYAGKKDFVELLIRERCCDVNKRIAVFQHGAPGREDKKQEVYPVELALRDPEMLLTLINLGADLSIVSPTAGRPLIYRVMKERSVALHLLHIFSAGDLAGIGRKCGPETWSNLLCGFIKTYPVGLLSQVLQIFSEKSLPVNREVVVKQLQGHKTSIQKFMAIARNVRNREDMRECKRRFEVLFGSDFVNSLASPEPRAAAFSFSA